MLPLLLLLLLKCSFDFHNSWSKRFNCVLKSAKVVLSYSGSNRCNWSRWSVVHHDLILYFSNKQSCSSTCNHCTDPFTLLRIAFFHRSAPKPMTQLPFYSFIYCLLSTRFARSVLFSLFVRFPSVLSSFSSFLLAGLPWVTSIDDGNAKDSHRKYSIIKRTTASILNRWNEKFITNSCLWAHVFFCYSVWPAIRCTWVDSPLEITIC